MQLDANPETPFFEASGNRFLTEHYNSINSIIETIRHYISQTNDATQTSLKDHRALVEQVANGRLEEAVRQLEKHIVNWSRRAILEPVLL